MRVKTLLKAYGLGILAATYAVFLKVITDAYSNGGSVVVDFNHYGEMNLEIFLAFASLPAILLLITETANNLQKEYREKR